MAKDSQARRPIDPQHQIVHELEAVKRLLAVLLIKAGTSQSEIAAALKIDRADVSRMLPARQFKPFKENGKE